MHELKVTGGAALQRTLREMEAESQKLVKSALRDECARMLAEMQPDIARASMIYHLTGIRKP